MATLAFDTHKFIKDLSGAGMNVEQAEVLAYHYTTLLTDRIATKEDISLLRKDMGKDMEHLRLHIEGKMVSLEERLEGKMVSLEERLEGKMLAMGKDLWIKVLVSQVGIGGLIIAVLGYLG